MKSYILVNQNNLSELNDLYFSKDTKREFSYLNEKLKKMTNHIYNCDFNKYSNEDYKLLAIKKSRIEIYISKIKNDLKLIDEEFKMGVLNEKFLSFLYLSIFEMECNFFYNDFWFIFNKALKIKDDRTKGILKQTKFYSYLSDIKLKLFFADKNVSFNSFVCNSENMNKVFENIQSYTPELDILKNWLNLMGNNDNLALIEKKY